MASASAPIKYTSDFVIAVDKNVKKPRRATTYSGGIDLFAPFDFELNPGEQKTIDMGIKLNGISKLCSGRIIDRSSMYMNGIRVFNGLIDGDYQGKIKLIIKSETHKVTKITKNQAIAQMILLQNFPHLNASKEVTRGEGGFGSTNAASTSALSTIDQDTQDSLRLIAQDIEEDPLFKRAKTE